jgi:hypothetical protein
MAGKTLNSVYVHNYVQFCVHINQSGFMEEINRFQSNSNCRTRKNTIVPSLGGMSIDTSSSMSLP